MNNLRKRDIECILKDVSHEVNLPYEKMQSMWNNCVTKYLERQGGIVIKRYGAEPLMCQHFDCNKKVLKPTIVNDQILCSVHLKHFLQQLKKQNSTRCAHIFTGECKQHIQGSQCTALVSKQSQSKYCKRHSKKE